MEKYIGSRLKNDILIDRLYSVHYFEYPKNFKFKGESHDFWELVYVDKGSITVFAGEKEFTLPQGNIIFHKPGEWHSLHSPADSAVNVAVVSFASSSCGMNFFNGKKFVAGQEHKTLISKIISEYTNAFQSPLNNPYTTRLYRKKAPVFGSEQLIRQYIAELLISFIRQSEPALPRSRTSLNRDGALCNMLINYMLDHITENVTVDELISYSGSNKTTIAKAFRHSFDMGIIEYFISLKINLAKKYLREDNYNISQIAELLGYSAVHYFSRQFKKVTGMSPSEYSASIQAIIEK